MDLMMVFNYVANDVMLFAAFFSFWESLEDP